MFGRRRVVQDEVVADLMKRFFRVNFPSLEDVAREYGNFLWNDQAKGLVRQEELSRSRFHVGLSISDCTASFARITKQATLVSDTLLLSHDWTGQFHDLTMPRSRLRGATGPRKHAPAFGVEVDIGAISDAREWENRASRSETYGMFCPDLPGLGQWIIDAKPLLKAGLAWYLPSYSTAKLRRSRDGRMKEIPRSVRPEQVKAIDYLVRDGRAIDASGAEPIKSQFVRPVLQTELPFLAGVDLRDFSKITIEEFGSYSAFRDFLRRSLLELDDSLNDTQSEREMLKLGLRINDEVRAARAEMTKVRRKRAVAASGAALGSVAAILVAVYGPALQAAITALGVSGGVWGVINAAADNNARALREDKWYYVWALAHNSA
ncbi:hypothetical protein [Amycolatopsis silviterrae]|uniref:Uncharacterized protein n=1 Tax=Amycolatopsis silviterrae TaxID=1656914 RepID=A0ABW5H6T7_9PSEU